ncbi:MAG: tannase/feruloyl esterase family alpha/beta hydrolase [Acidobacteriia bacterium]|nr:tannase/feruloyl esterase family alpha/beta hydrolase [Terriglobia bacterium]
MPLNSNPNNGGIEERGVPLRAFGRFVAGDRLGVAAFLTALLAIVALAPARAASAQSCESLASLKLPNTTITSAAVVPAGAFTPPTGPVAVTEEQIVRYGAVKIGSPTSVTLPSFCRVRLNVAPAVRIEVWLPASGWNGNFEGVGNGGLAGVISYTALVNALKLGYATASTDTGHEASDERWALGHPELVVDYGHRAIHEMTETAKRVIDAFYGTGPRHSYFDGCSTGGKQALTEAQRYPDDYDGIVAGGPANYFTHLMGSALWTIVVTTKDPESYIPPSKLGMINDASVAACDALDGVKDGVLNDPRKCRFDPSILLCKGSDSPNCLTPKQIDALKKIYSGPVDVSGKLIYPGTAPGFEKSWERFITGATPGTSHNADLAIPFFRYLMFGRPDWDFRTWDYERDMPATDKKLGPILNAIDPDLRPFRAHGGKLLIYHGWQDSGISPLNTINYYKSVVAFMNQVDRSAFERETEAFLNASKQTDSFIRLFMVPGVEHCDRLGGPGPDRSNFFGALANWVEHNQPPETILASHVTNGTVDRTRPLCPFPLTAQYSGHGSIDDAANFVCKLPNRN